MNEKLHKVVTVWVRIREVSCWAGIVAAPVLLVLLMTVTGKYKDILMNNAALQRYMGGVQMILTVGEINVPALVVFCLMLAADSVLLALVYRNLYFILKNSENSTPFIPDNVGRMRTMAFLLIAMPIVSFVFNVASMFVVGADAVDLAVSSGDILLGLLVLCLSEMFRRGTITELNVDGLL